MVGNPNEIEPSERREHGQDPDHGRASVFDPCVEKNAGEQDREDELGDHRCKLSAERSIRIDSELPSFWPFASEYALYSIVTGTSMYLSLLAETWLRNSEACAIRFCRSRIPRAPRRVIARKPLWVSVRERPLVMRVNQVAALSRSRRAGGRLTAPPRKRLPSAKSASCSASAPIKPSMSATRCCPSASKVTITSAPSCKANSMPVCRAAPCPRLTG